MDVWQKKGGTTRDRERGSWSDRDADHQSFEHNERRSVGGQYKTYSATNQDSRKDTATFAKPNEPFYKYKQDYTKATNYEHNVSSRSRDDTTLRDSFTVQSRSSFSKNFDPQSENFASEAYGQGMGSKRFIAQDNSEFDIEPYAMQDKGPRRDSYSGENRKISSGPYNSVDDSVSYTTQDRKFVSDKPYRSQDDIFNKVRTSDDRNHGTLLETPYHFENRNLGSKSYRSQEMKHDAVPSDSQARTMSHRPLMAEDSNYRNMVHTSQGSTFGQKPYYDSQEKGGGAHHSRDSYLDSGRFNIQDKDVRNVPYISQAPQVRRDMHLDSVPYDSRANDCRNEMISKDIHPHSRSYNALDKDIGERPYISANLNIAGVPHSTENRKYIRGPDDLQDRSTNKWHHYPEDDRDRQLGMKPYASQDRRTGSPPYTFKEKSLGNMSYIPQDRDISIEPHLPQSRKLDGGPYNLQDRNHESGQSYAQKPFKSQEITPRSGPYYLQDKTHNERPFISQDRGPGGSGNKFSSSSRTFYRSKSTDELSPQRKALNTQEGPSYVNKVDDVPQFLKPPVTFTKKPVPYDMKSRSFDNEPQSYIKKPAPFGNSPRSYENKQRPENDATRSLINKPLPYDSRPKPYGNKRLSVETEPRSKMGRPRSYDNRPEFRDMEPRSGDNYPRSYDNRPKPYGSKRLSVETEPRSNIGKPRSYDNRPGFYRPNMEQRSDDNNPPSYDDRLDHFDNKHPTRDYASRSFVDKPSSYKNFISNDNDHRSFDNRPERYDDKRPSNDDAPQAHVGKPRSYDNRPGLRAMEKKRSNDNNPRSSDNRSEWFDGKRLSRDGEPQSFITKPRSYDNRPDFCDVPPKSGDDRRPFTNRAESFDDKRPSRNDEPHPLIAKPRSYDNKPGFRDMKRRSDNDNPRSYDNRPESFDDKRPSRINEPQSLIGKQRSYNNRPDVHDVEPRSYDDNRRSYDERSPSSEKEGVPRSQIKKLRSYNNRPDFRDTSPKPDSDIIKSYDNRSQTYLDESQYHGVTLQPNVKQRIGLKRKFQSALKPLMDIEQQFPIEDDPTSESDAPTSKSNILNKEAIFSASKLIHNEVVKGFIFATCSNEELLHKMVVYLIRHRMRQIAAPTVMDTDTLVSKYRIKNPSALDYAMAESISIRLEGETTIDTEAITPAEWRAIMTQFSNIFPQEHLKLLAKKPVTTKRAAVAKPKKVKAAAKKKSAPGKGNVTKHPLTIDDVDNGIEARAAQIKKVILEVAKNDSTADPVQEYLNKKILAEAAEQIRIVLIRNLSAALIRPDADEEFLMLRIFGNPKLPSQQQLEKWLQPYHVRQLKRSFRTKTMCIARVKNREAYDALLANKTPVVAGLPLMIKPSDHMTPKILKMSKIIQKNKTWVTVVSKKKQQMILNKRNARQNALHRELQSLDDDPDI